MRSIPRVVLAAVALLATALPAAGPADSPHQLTFEQRVAAQRAIERVYYSHQEGATRPFDEAVPREVLEEKVRTYLKQSVALEMFWNTPVTAATLAREAARIESQTQYPDRLGQIRKALGDDPVLFQETFVRSSLVDRLARELFASDERIHGEGRREADTLREDLAAGRLDPRADHPQRTVVRMTSEEANNRGDVGDAAASARLPDGAKSLHLPLTVVEGTLASSGEGDVGPVEDEPYGFVIRTLMTKGTGSIRVSEHTVPKRSWSVWWKEVERRFPETEARSVATVSAVAARGSLRAGRPRRDSGRRTTQVEPTRVSCPPDDSWDSLPFGDHPHAMARHVAVWTGTEMIVWGGRSVGGYRYDPATDTWDPISVLGAPKTGQHAKAVWTGTEMIVWDGLERQAGRYSPDSDSWIPVPFAGAPSRRIGSSAIWTGSEMVVWGGFNPSGSSLAGGGAFNPSTGGWRTLNSGDQPAPRNNPSAVWADGRMIVWGGLAPDPGGVYDFSTNQWTRISTTNAPLNGYGAVWTGKEMFAGGALFDPNSNTWRPAARHEISVAGYLISARWPLWTGKEVLIGGLRYDPQLDQWNTISRKNAPRLGEYSSAIWTGSEMIAWGGVTTGWHGATNAGGRYDPLTDSWRPTARIYDSPDLSGRFGGWQAVWTGREMILSSLGRRYDPLTNQWKPLDRPSFVPANPVVVQWTGDELLVWGPGGGGRYDPVRDLWRRIFTTNTPRLADHFSAIWTGKEFILWGGYFYVYNPNYEDYEEVETNTGYRYDLGSDTWTPTSTVGAPSGRVWHSGLWTGREMIVWGGGPGGGRYDPSTDTWRAISGAERFRGFPLWTGREMIVWGGDTPGGRYDPATDSWRSISKVGAPSFREGSAMLWTGEEMIVWGGREPGPFVWEDAGDGARYDPETDTWTPISMHGAPLRRGGPLAVWTGRSMIVYGGRLSGAMDIETKTGGIYHRALDRDRDSFTECQGDCDETSSTVHPGAPDIPGNSLDEDCDGETLCDPAAGWKSRGQLVRCVSTQCRRLVAAGTLQPADCESIVARAVHARRCGDGVLDEHETCDREALGGRTCRDLGFDGGALACNDTCDAFDLSGCSAACGDGIRAGFEACDGADLGGRSCVSQGFDSGELECQPNCKSFDQAACGAICGDGVKRGREACDGRDLGGRSCLGMGFDGGSLSCQESCAGVDVSGCTTTCGDGQRRGFEACDSDDIGDTGCWVFGFTAGTLRCDDTCGGFDTSSCTTCRNGVLESGETCDLVNTGTETCRSRGFDGGELRCAWNCDTFDVSGCTTVCGDGARRGREVCDGADLGGKGCDDFGFDGGDLSCLDSCQADLSRCTTVCGDGVARGEEECDGADLNGQTCEDRGLDRGTLTCTASCGFDTSGCIGCGDGRRNGWEECDGADLGGQDCGSHGFDGGQLFCNPWCELDVAGCTTNCGDGTRRGDERCDGSDLAGQTCQRQGFEAGALACEPECNGFDTSGCSYLCGNGVRVGPEVCDGNDLGSSCAGLGFNSGVLTCSPGCDAYVTTGCCCLDGRVGCPPCPVCGDGIRQAPFEACDRIDFGGETCESQGRGSGILICKGTCDGFVYYNCTVSNP